MDAKSTIKKAVFAGTLLAVTLAEPALNHQLVLQAAPAVGKADAGKAFWQAQMCQYCHGVDGEGAWGPDFTGGRLSEAEIRHALRRPWGLMPSYTETQVSEQTIADLQAFFATLPKAEQFGPWRWQSPPSGAPEGQRLQSAFGCGQCHEPELAFPVAGSAAWIRTRTSRISPERSISTLRSTPRAGWGATRKSGCRKWSCG